MNCIIINLTFFYKAPLGKIVSITSFERFRTEFNFDFVYIYDGTGQSKTKLASFSGLLSSITRISSTGRVLQIIFTRFFYKSINYSKNL